MSLQAGAKQLGECFLLRQVWPVFVGNIARVRASGEKERKLAFAKSLRTRLSKIFANSSVHASAPGTCA